MRFLLGYLRVRRWFLPSQSGVVHQYHGTHCMASSISYLFDGYQVASCSINSLVHLSKTPAYRSVSVSFIRNAGACIVLPSSSRTWYASAMAAFGDIVKNIGVVVVEQYRVPVGESRLRRIRWLTVCRNIWSAMAGHLQSGLSSP
jgi:hypothetical protein